MNLHGFPASSFCFKTAAAVQFLRGRVVTFHRQIRPDDAGLSGPGFEPGKERRADAGMAPGFPDADDDISRMGRTDIPPPAGICVLLLLQYHLLVHILLQT